MITERNYKMDNMKALMMYLVVFGHMLECFHGTVRWWGIYLAIYSFICLFLLILPNMAPK